MSTDNYTTTDMTAVCAACGIAEIDDVKLKDCDGCDLVRYCSDACQELHLPEHAGNCRLRAAELRDEVLFKQPESTHFGDCPICCLPLPLGLTKATMYSCCSNLICNGCDIANKIREKEMRLEQSCPFCREPALLSTREECDKRRMKRVAVNIPIALCDEGMVQFRKGDYFKAFEYCKKAADLGAVEAHYRVGILYGDGKGVEKDIGKEIYHLEEAAIGGHPEARFQLGCNEMDNQNVERAVKHWIIAATQGEDESIKALMDFFKEGFVKKEDLASALRAHQAAVDATKSPQREAAEQALEKWHK